MNTRGCDFLRKKLPQNVYRVVYRAQATVCSVLGSFFQLGVPVFEEVVQVICEGMWEDGVVYQATGPTFHPDSLHSESSSVLPQATSQPSSA